MKTNITQPSPSLPYPPADASEYDKLLHRTLDARLKDIYNRIDAIIPHTATDGTLLRSEVSGNYAGNVTFPP